MSSSSPDDMPVNAHSSADDLRATGLGLDKDVVRLERVPEAWLTAGSELAARLQVVFGPLVVDVVHIGSASVPGLLAKPIIDLAAGFVGRLDLSSIIGRAEGSGWDYRGDGGENGGHVFVLEHRPEHRVAHLHVVEHEGRQWRNYLRFRDLLRRSPQARRRYEEVKLDLADEYRNDRLAYTDGKTDIVGALLAELDSVD